LACVFLLAWTRYAAFAAQLTSYWDLSPGTQADEVFYLLGVPPEVVGDFEQAGEQHFRAVYFTDPKKDPVNAIPAGKKAKDFSLWAYPAIESEPEGPSVTVEFDRPGGAVKEIACVALRVRTQPACPALLGVAVGSAEGDVIELLGAPTSSELSGVVKHLRYDDLGVRFTLEKGRVYILALRHAKPSASILIRRFLNRII
jgi:hypothetical protein